MAPATHGDKPVHNAPGMEWLVNGMEIVSDISLLRDEMPVLWLIYFNGPPAMAMRYLEPFLC